MTRFRTAASPSEITWKQQNCSLTNLTIRCISKLKKKIKTKASCKIEKVVTPLKLCYHLSHSHRRQIRSRRRSKPIQVANVPLNLPKALASASAIRVASSRALQSATATRVAKTIALQSSLKNYHKPP